MRIIESISFEVEHEDTPFLIYLVNLVVWREGILAQKNCAQGSQIGRHRALAHKVVLLSKNPIVILLNFK